MKFDGLGESANMDVKETSVNAPRNISEEVLIIFELITEFRTKRNGAKDEEEKTKKKRRRRKGEEEKAKDKANRAEKFRVPTTIAGLGAIALIAGLLYFLPASIWAGTSERIRLVAQAFILVCYVVGGIVLLIHYLSLKHFFSDFTGNLLTAIAGATKDEVALFEKLDSLSTESIQYVAKRFDAASSQLGSLKAFLIGAIEKVGIIPGVIATALAISKVSTSSDFSWIEMVSIILLGFYAVMFPLTEAIIRFKHYAFILNRYLELFRVEEGS